MTQKNREGYKGMRYKKSKFERLYSGAGLRAVVRGDEILEVEEDAVAKGHIFRHVRHEGLRSLCAVSSVHVRSTYLPILFLPMLAKYLMLSRNNLPIIISDFPQFRENRVKKMEDVGEFSTKFCRI